MSIILQSFRLMQRQFATHLPNPILRRFPPPTTSINKSINQQGFLSFLPKTLQPRIGQRWSIIPKPVIRPSVFHNIPILSSTFQNISPLRNRVSGNQLHTENTKFQQTFSPDSKLENQEVTEEDMLYNRIDRWSKDVASCLLPESLNMNHEVLLTDSVIHDIVANRFVFPILTPDDF